MVFNEIYRRDKNSVFNINMIQKTIQKPCKMNRVIKMENILGKGAYGTVCKAVLTNPDGKVTIVASKTNVINKFLPCEASMVNHRMEGDKMKLLNHKNIIKFISYENIILNNNNTEHIFMEYIEHSLSDYIKILKDKGNKMDKMLVKSYMYQLLSALDYLKGVQLLHRDIKPSNIMVDRNGVLKVIDFGMSRFIKQNTNIDKCAYTVYYRPPEVFFGCENYSFSADIWAAGCVFAEMILLVPFFEPNTKYHIGEDLSYGYECLLSIFDVLGKPSNEDFKGLKGTFILKIQRC